MGLTLRVSLFCIDGYRRGVLVEMVLPYGHSRPRSEYSDTGRTGTYIVLYHLDLALSSEYDSYPAWGVRGNVDHDEKNHKT